MFHKGAKTNPWRKDGGVDKAVLEKLDLYLKQ